MVIIGAGLAAKLGLRVGRRDHPDRAQGQCHALRHHAAGQDLSQWPASSEIGNTLYDSNFIFMPLDEAQDYFNIGDTVSGIEVMVTDPDSDLAMLPAI